MILSNKPVMSPKIEVKTYNKSEINVSWYYKHCDMKEEKDTIYITTIKK